MSSEALEKSTRMVVDCWNRADWTRLRSMAGADYVYEEPGTGRQVPGIDPVLVAWTWLRAGFPDTSAEIVDIRVDGPFTLTSLIWRTVQSAPLRTGCGLEPPSYKTLVLADLVVMRWEAAQLVRERHQNAILSLLAPLLGPPTG